MNGEDICNAAEYGQVDLVASYRTDRYLAAVYTMGYGDDGGPATITAYFTHGTSAEADPDVGYMVQEFDTGMQLIWREGALCNTPYTWDQPCTHHKI